MIRVLGKIGTVYLWLMFAIFSKPAIYLIRTQGYFDLILCLIFFFPLLFLTLEVWFQSKNKIIQYTIYFSSLFLIFIFLNPFSIFISWFSFPRRYFWYNLAMGLSSLGLTDVPVLTILFLLAGVVFFIIVNINIWIIKNNRKKNEVRKWV